MEIVLTALIGALAAGFLNFKIRDYLDRRGQEELEKKVAYVHLVRISEIVAAGRSFNKIMKVLLGEEVYEKLSVEGEGYSSKHAWSLRLSKLISDAKEKGELGSKNVEDVSALLKSMASQALSEQLTTEELSKLPKGAIFTAYKFKKQSHYIVQAVDLWSKVLSGAGYQEFFSPQGICDQWDAIEKYFKLAEEMRDHLVAYGACSHVEAIDLLMKQTGIIYEEVRSKLGNSISLNAAVKDVEL